MPIKKLCSYSGCNVLVDYGTKYCYKHRTKDKERYKDYRRSRLQDKEEKARQEFYNSTEWKNMRDLVIKKCFGIDIVEYYKTGQIIMGYTVHHIIELKEDWEKRLDINNLIYLSQENHVKIHKMMERSKEDKDKVIEMLLELKARFEQEFILEKEEKNK
ncbi:HNH endonuclease [Clostridium sp.]|uniref:HNH endonuclease n=1 Tax=Clostridium sp. TaxID=1506 RepID=UPI00290459CF|nr:HNH endonuclease [Clostridium sp.]MDU1968856.1 hypothetical protein [Clostridium perfringens]MDU1822392.1 hypothetical protein [Clostridium sp.]MDU1841558.1 hypothetical protein [Clostridium sp.]MDU2689630.1 hypothetical protein [Clostridium sp.]MDU2955813.1 hypothetical protein [Clostridium sp.]